MADKQSILNELENSVKTLNQGGAVEGATRAIASGVNPVEAIDALSRGIRDVGEKFAKKEMFVVELIYAASIMRVKVLDHIIIGNDRYFSFAGAGLIEQYELDFLNLKMKGTSEAKRRVYQAKLSDAQLPWQS